MMVFWLSLILLSAATQGVGETPCLRLGEGVSRPLPFPSSADPAQYRFVAEAQDWVAIVHLAPEELAAPAEVRAELFLRGTKKAERTLFLRGRLGQTITATKSDGSKVEVGLLAAAVSPDGSLLALLSGLKILVFREEEFLGAVEAGFFPSMAVSPQGLFWCPWAHKKGEPVLMRWGLDSSQEPEVVLVHERDAAPGKKLVAVRNDGLLWVVDGFTGEPWLVTDSGTVKKRLDPLRPTVVSEEKAVQRQRELAEQLPQEARDATRRPPQVEFLPVGEDPWVSEIQAMGNDLLVFSERAPDKLFWLPDDARVWQCLQLPSSARGAKRSSLAVTSEGFWVSRETGPVFFPRASLQDLGRQKRRERESETEGEHTTP